MPPRRSLSPHHTHSGEAGSPTLVAADVDAHAATGFGAVDVTARIRAGTDRLPVPGWIASLRAAGWQFSQAARLLA